MGLNPQPNDGFLTGIHASAADQFLISYLTLSRFRGVSPYSLGFALGHCLELSLKVAYWQTEGKAPKHTHDLGKIINNLKGDLKSDLDSVLPSCSIRNDFKRDLDALLNSPPLDQVRKYFDYSDESWLLLFTIYALPDIKYGVDRQQRVMQLMQSTSPKLNGMALRTIGHLRRRFPSPESHRWTIERFIEDHVPPVEMSPVRKLLRAMEAQLKAPTSEADALQNSDDDSYDSKEITSDGAMEGANGNRSSCPRLIFSAEELRLIKSAFGLHMRSQPNVD